MVFRKIIYIIILILSFLFLIFYSRYFPILLFCELIILPVLLYGLLIIMKRNISICVKTFNGYGYKNKESAIDIIVSNKSILPISKIDINVVYEDNMGNKIEKIIRMSVNSKESRNIKYNINPKKCGVVKVYVDYFLVYDYFSLFSKGKRVYEEDKLIVLPNIHIFSSDIINDKIRVGRDNDVYSENEQGDDPSQVFDIREYVDGDKIQRIHWNLSSKFDNLMIKEYSMPLLESTIILIELFVDKKNPKAGALIDGLIESTYSISSYFISIEYPHYMAWYNKNKGIEKIEIRTKDDLLYAIKKVLEVSVYEDDLYALKDYCSLQSRNTNSKIIYLSTKVDEEVIKGIDLMSTEEDSKVVLLASLEGSEVALDLEGNKNTNVVDIDSFHESLDRLII